jgi:hypothetical protein
MRYGTYGTVLSLTGYVLCGTVRYGQGGCFFDAGVWMEGVVCYYYFSLLLSSHSFYFSLFFLSSSPLIISIHRSTRRSISA